MSIRSNSMRTYSTYTESGIYGEIRALPTQNPVYTGRYVLYLHRIRYIRGDTYFTYTESGIYGEIRTCCWPVSRDQSLLVAC